MAFNTQYALTKNESFRAKIKLAMVQTAVDIQGGAFASPPTAQESRRSIYAVNVLNTPDVYLDRFVVAVAADETITDLSTDAVIKARCSAIWNALAGVM